MKKNLQKALTITIVTYGVVVFLLWLLQWVVGEEVVGMGIVKTILHLLLLISVLLLPIVLFLRRMRLALVLLPSVIAFFFSYGPYLIPRMEDAPAALPTLRLMTFNIETPTEDEVATLVQIIDAADADIVALQELSPAAAAAFEAQLGEEYPYRSLHPVEAYAGQGVLSRFPIQEDEYFRYEGLPGSLGHQRVVLTIDEQPVVLYNVHPVPPVTFEQYLNAAPHRTALRRLIEDMDAEEAPLLTSGDFNMTDHFHSYRELTAQYTDAYREVGEVGMGFTYPNKEQVPLPALLRLDYIFYDSPFMGIRSAVWPNSGSSDHAPVIADLVLNDLPTNAAMRGAHEEWHLAPIKFNSSIRQTHSAVVAGGARF